MTMRLATISALLASTAGLIVAAGGSASAGVSPANAKYRPLLTAVEPKVEDRVAGIFGRPPLLPPLAGVETPKEETLVAGGWTGFQGRIRLRD